MSRGELYKTSKLWSFLQSKSVNNVCDELLQLLSDVYQTPFAPGLNWGRVLCYSPRMKIPGAFTAPGVTTPGSPVSAGVGVPLERRQRRGDSQWWMVERRAGGQSVDCQYRELVADASLCYDGRCMYRCRCCRRRCCCCCWWWSRTCSIPQSSA